MSWASPCSWLPLTDADSVLAAWSISSAACRIDCVACSVPPTMAASSRLARAVCSLLVRLGAERGHFVPGALDRGIDQAELVLVGLRLRDLRPRALERVAVDLGARPDQLAQRLQLGHELAMLQRAFRVARGNALGRAPARALLDPKHLALNRHRRPRSPRVCTTAPLKIGFIARSHVHSRKRRG